MNIKKKASNQVYILGNNKTLQIKIHNMGVLVFIQK